MVKETSKTYWVIYWFFLIGFVVLSMLLTGCQTQPTVVDTGDIERLRQEHNAIRAEYERLQSDYNKLTKDSQFYADYYQQTTATIGTGLGELSTIGASNESEIAKLRKYVEVLRNIVNNIINGESGLKEGIVGSGESKEQPP